MIHEHVLFCDVLEPASAFSDLSVYHIEDITRCTILCEWRKLRAYDACCGMHEQPGYKDGLQMITFNIECMISTTSLRVRGSGILILHPHLIHAIMSVEKKWVDHTSDVTLGALRSGISQG